jgi:transposase
VRKFHLGKDKADSAQELLRALANTGPEQRFMHRLHCVVLVAEGHSCAEVARWFGGSRRTIERWVHSFEKDGIEGIRAQRGGGGRPAKMTGVRLRELAVDSGSAARCFGVP